MTMTSNRPYLTRALYQWIVDNDLTPYILVDSDWPLITLPLQFSNEDKIVLNISPIATRDLQITNQHISFLTRFDGEAFTIQIPVSAILAIYAKENGQGMVFDPEPYPDENDISLVESSSTTEEASPLMSLPTSEEASSSSKKKESNKKMRPSLKIVK